MYCKWCICVIYGFIFIIVGRTSANYVLSSAGGSAGALYHNESLRLPVRQKSTPEFGISPLTGPGSSAVQDPSLPYLEHFQSHFTSHSAPLITAVSVNCTSTDLVVRVKRYFYGLSTSEGQLKLGRTCLVNGVDQTSGDLLFTYPLTACESKREVRPRHILYKFVLRYTLRPDRLVRQKSRVKVDIECRLKRYHHIYRLAVKPAWDTPKRKVLRGQSARYRMRLMNDDQSAAGVSNTYFLGQKINLQVSAMYLPSTAKLYIDHCYATVSDIPGTTPKHMIVENFGCMAEATGFFITRTRNSITFGFSTFLFSRWPAAQIFVHCKLFMTEGRPSPAAKSCFYSKDEDRWKALEGPNSLCDCCNTVCVPLRGKQVMYEGFQSSGPLVLTSQVSGPSDAPPITDGPAHPTVLGGSTDNIWLEDAAWQEGYEHEEHDTVRTVPSNRLTKPRLVGSVTSEAGCSKEPTPTESYSEGVDHISFSDLMEADDRHYSLGGGMGNVRFLSDYNGPLEVGNSVPAWEETSQPLTHSGNIAVDDDDDDDQTRYFSGVGEVMVLSDNGMWER